MTEESFLTTDEVAQQLRVTRYCVACWIRDGRLPAYRAGHKWLIKAADVAALIRKGTASR